MTCIEVCRLLYQTWTCLNIRGQLPYVMKPPPLRPWLPLPALRRRPTTQQRLYAVQAPGAPTLQVFNPRVKFLQKERAATNTEQSRKTDYLKDEVAQRLVDRLLDIDRRFPKVLDLGANSCNIARAISKPPLPIPGTPEDVPPTPPKLPLEDRIGQLICAESSATTLHRDNGLDVPTLPIENAHLASLETLPFEPETFDAVLSSLSLHWVNDLPSLLSSINSILKPDSPFLAAMFGGDTYTSSVLLYSLQTSNDWVG